MSDCDYFITLYDNMVHNPAELFFHDQGIQRKLGKPSRSSNSPRKESKFPYISPLFSLTPCKSNGNKSNV